MGDGLRQRGSSSRRGERRALLLDEALEKRDLGIGMLVVVVFANAGMDEVTDPLLDDFSCASWQSI